MSYFVTGATGFIGRHLVEELIDHRSGTVFALVRETSRPRLERMIEVWGTDRVIPVVGDLAADGLGVDEVVAILVAHPSLLQRPILDDGSAAMIGRPRSRAAAWAAAGKVVDG